MNWVEKRQDCSAAHVLVDLEWATEESVQTRIKQLEGSGEPMPRHISHDEDPGFSVVRNGRLVAFDLKDMRTIRVRGDDGKIDFDIHVTMRHVDPRCVSVVEGEELEPWQVLYMALDKLLF